MPEVIESQRSSNFRPLQDAFVNLCDVGMGRWSSDFRWKNKIVIFPNGTETHPLFELRFSMNSKFMDNRRRQGYLSSRTRRLRFGEIPRLFRQPNNHAPHACGRAVEIEILQLKTQIFLRSHSFRECERKHRPMPFHADFGKLFWPISEVSLAHI